MDLGRSDVPLDVLAKLVEAHVRYIGFDSREHEGALIVHEDLKGEVEGIFRDLLMLRFPIEKIEPMQRYNWDDDASMEDNNTSAFNYRLIKGTNRISNHSHGRAIDINPRQNPYLAYDGKIYPAGAVYDVSVPGTVDGRVIEVFASRGFIWGGTWEVPHDYQHFEKP